MGTSILQMDDEMATIPICLAFSAPWKGRLAKRQHVHERVPRNGQLLAHHDDVALHKSLDGNVSFVTSA